MKIYILFLIILTCSSYAAQCPKLDGTFLCPASEFSERYTVSLKSHHNGYTYTDGKITDRLIITGIREDVGDGYFETELCEKNKWVLITEFPNGTINRVERFLRDDNIVNRIITDYVEDYSLSNTDNPKALEFICKPVKD